MNRYLQDRAMRRGRYMRDGRNPYGSRGGYVTSRRGGRGSDYAMDNRNFNSEYDSRYDGRGDYNYRSSDGHYPMERYGEHHRPMQYEIYGVGGMRPREDYRSGDYGMRDYGYDMNDYDYASEDKEYREDLKEWCKKLKKHDKFGMPKEDIISQARQMGVKFDKFDEEEFLTTYYMMMSDYKMDMLNSPQAYMILAKQWLDDEDSELKGSEKLCAYLYEIVKGGEED